MKETLSNADLRLTILGCFRYALGRMTYMPEHIVDVIHNNQELFGRTDWRRFVKEIDETDILGIECDRNVWRKLIKLAQEKLQ